MEEHGTSADCNLDSTLGDSTIPQATVGKEHHQIISSNAVFDDLTKPSLPTHSWWKRLIWVDKDVYNSIVEVGEVSSQHPVKELFLRAPNQTEKRFKLLINDLGPSLLLTFLPIEQPVKDTILIEQAFESTEFRTGDSYFRFYAKAFCQSLQMDYAIIARLKEDGAHLKAETITFYNTKAGFLPNMDYELTDTPCWLPYKNPVPTHIPQGLQQAFPKDLDLVKMGAVSYLGLPILDENSKAIGHLALLSSSPTKKPTYLEEMFLKIFAARSNAEFQRSDIESQLHSALEKAEDANQSKTRFLANMSHEFRSPLNAILGYSQLLDKNSNLGDNEHQQVASIARNGRHLLSLINDILDMSRIELDHITPHPHSFTLSRLHEDIETMFRPETLTTESELLFEISEDLPQTIFADEDKLRQILTNLMSNAIKYGDGSQIQYRAEKKKSDPNSTELLAFTVFNTGPSISDEDKLRLFLPFERGTKQSLTPIDGTGLGLSIARSFAHAMDGELVVDNQSTTGTSFILTIPLVEGTIAARNNNAPIARKEKLTPTGTVLIVDDNEASRDIVRQILEDTGLSIIEATDGIEGLEACLKEHPDLVLMDVRMPRMSGLEASERIRDKLKENCPPIIGLTGDLLDVKGSPAKHEIFDLVIGKPFDFNTLLLSVNNMLEKSRPSSS